MKTKYCRVLQKMVPIDQFDRDGRTKDGFSCVCREGRRLLQNQNKERKQIKNRAQMQPEKTTKKDNPKKNFPWSKGKPLPEETRHRISRTLKARNAAKKKNK